jgi:hypothetical protein
MRHLSSLLHGCGKRVKRASHLLLVIAGLWACRRAAPPTRSSTDAVEGRDARPDAVCASRLSRFRADLAAVPLDVEWREQWLQAPPSIDAALTLVGTVEGPIAMVRLTDVSLSGTRWSLDAFDPSDFRDNLLRRYGEMPDLPLYVLVDRRASIATVRDVRDAVAQAEHTGQREFRLALLFRHPRHVDYAVPDETPPWSREAVVEIRRSGWSRTVAAKPPLERAAPRCPGAVGAALAVIENGIHHSASEAALVAAVTACGCEHVDVDALAGLVLGTIAYRNPYGYVRLATSPKAKHRIKVPLSGSMADIAAAWPATAGDEAVWIDFE